MSEKNYYDKMNLEIIEDVMENIISIFGTTDSYLTKNECRNILNIVFETLFDEKLKNKNFNYIFKLISKNENKIFKQDLEPIIRSFIVCFDVNYITNSSSFNDKVCIKIGKHLLPISYYIKKNND
jgi:hypothetical protein